MHPQLLILALFAPLALSLPRPDPQGESSALVPRQGSGNSTGWAEGDHHRGKFFYRPGGHHPERDVAERDHSGNSTGGWEHKYHEWRHQGQADGRHPERGLVDRHPPHPERDFTEHRDSGNATDGGEGARHREHRPEDGHRGPQVEKRIEEGNGTTGGETGREKFRPDGGRHGDHREHERALSSNEDGALDKRQGANSTGAGGEEGRGRHEGGNQAHFQHEWA